ncbi:hypothetical protein F5X99DRAFT_409780 [Biscogniauxia marginata]|nr:hypothetical protein F5X99DRAFT_409780 [Biscogniauxia marginata]
MEYSRGRAPAPAPLTIDKSGGATARRQDSFGSDFSDHEKELSRSAPSHWFGEHRKGLNRRTSSMSHTKPASPTVNLYTHCGRHSDQYLFGGWTDLIRSTFKKE